MRIYGNIALRRIEEKVMHTGGREGLRVKGSGTTN
jgi:hypothetical protein